MKIIKFIVAVLLIWNSNTLFADKLENILLQHSTTNGNIESWKKVENLTYD